MQRQPVPVGLHAIVAPLKPPPPPPPSPPSEPASPRSVATSSSCTSQPAISATIDRAVAQRTFATIPQRIVSRRRVAIMPTDKIENAARNQATNRKTISRNGPLRLVAQSALT